MKMSARGITGLEEFEGVELEAYPDPASPLGRACTAAKLKVCQYRKLANWKNLNGSPWTIGAGWTGPVDGAAIVPGMVITRARADALLATELKKYEEGVTALVKVPLTQGQFDALVSFSWNLGLQNLKTSRLLRYLNAGAYGAAAGQFMLWVKAGGVVMDGLKKRRRIEQSWFIEE